ncbi:hypothetical protein LK994_11310 [Ferruginibacter lapsinanis]|nr:hypothetical protein [Ferruginibacter lapsinanis]UEG49218.1 hypothetical protein LK994_11310 [Ferruginibacter lapsinanis]
MPDFFVIVQYVEDQKEGRQIAGIAVETIGNKKGLIIEMKARLLLKYST